MQTNTFRKTGWALIIVTVLLLALNSFSLTISSWLGKLSCGATYLQEIDGILSDRSCGFNADMYLAALLLILLLIGMILISTAKK